MVYISFAVNVYSFKNNTLLNQSNNHKKNLNAVLDVNVSIDVASNHCAVETYSQ